MLMMEADVLYCWALSDIWPFQFDVDGIGIEAGDRRQEPSMRPCTR